MLDTAKPEAASVMTSISDHRMAVDACAPHGVHTLLEKPLAYSNDDARHMAELAKKHNVLVLTNYETSWYASIREAKRRIDSGEMSPVRHMVFRHGHRGPKEIGLLARVPCVADGSSSKWRRRHRRIWLLRGRALDMAHGWPVPTSVVATASTLNPDVYPKVDDDATIVLSYPTSTAVIQASWAWTHDNKEMDIHTEKGSLHAGRWDDLELCVSPTRRQSRSRPPKGQSRLRTNGPISAKSFAASAKSTDCRALRPIWLWLRYSMLHRQQVAKRRPSQVK